MMNRLFRGPNRPPLVKVLLASLLLMCMGGFAVIADADTSSERSFINNDPQLIQIYSPNKLELSKIEAEAVEVEVSHDSLCEFTFSHHQDSKPTNLVSFTNHRSQAPPAHS